MAHSDLSSSLKNEAEESDPWMTRDQGLRRPPTDSADYFEVTEISAPLSWKEVCSSPLACCYYSCCSTRDYGPPSKRLGPGSDKSPDPAETRTYLLNL